MLLDLDNSANRPSQRQTKSLPTLSITMAALMTREMAQLAKRENWAKQEAGVVVVLCIVFVVAVGLVGLYVYKKVKARKEAKQTV